jgi:hypothetical protein
MKSKLCYIGDSYSYDLATVTYKIAYLVIVFSVAGRLTLTSFLHYPIRRSHTYFHVLISVLRTNREGK